MRCTFIMYLELILVINSKMCYNTYWINKGVTKMIGFYDYTTILTYLSLISGVIGIFNAMNGKPLLSIVCLLISGLCDMFDGKVARSKKGRTKSEKDYGIQLDSLCDLVCFGVLPITIGYAVGLNKTICLLVFIPYLLGALIRLAYFNMLENVRQLQIIPKEKTFIGVPVTTAALVFPFTYIFKGILGFNFIYLYGVMMVILAILFVVKITIKKPSNKAMIIFLIIGVVELVLILKMCHII